MPKAANLTQYVRKNHRKVQGWLLEAAIAMITQLNEAQKQFSIEGNICEIGIHHGRLFILLYLLATDQEKALAIDVFEDQHLNIDGSGVGNRQIFEYNLNKFVQTQENLIILKSDSTQLDGASLKELVAGEFRLFSIDGGHTKEITFHDLTTASEALTPGGIIILDDYFNEAWPGVSQGTNYFFSQNKPIKIAPFAIGGNKVFLTTLEYANKYREFLANCELLNTKDYIIYRKMSTLFGHEVFCFIAEAKPKYILKQLLKSKIRSVIK